MSDREVLGIMRDQHDRSAGTGTPPAARQALGLVVWLGVTFVAAALGGVASSVAGSFYTQLNRPDWAPPAAVFGPVWGLLYLMMGLAAWLVWRERGWRGAPVALALFCVQLIANALWTWLFFAWRQGLWSLVDILVLWALIVGTITAFRRVRPFAALLLLPYLAWVSFAAALTLAVWRLNPSLLD